MPQSKKMGTQKKGENQFSSTNQKCMIIYDQKLIIFSPWKRRVYVARIGVTLFDRILTTALIGIMNEIVAPHWAIIKKSNTKSFERLPGHTQIDFIRSSHEFATLNCVHKWFFIRRGGKAFRIVFAFQIHKNLLKLIIFETWLWWPELTNTKKKSKINRYNGISLTFRIHSFSSNSNMHLVAKYLF